MMRVVPIALGFVLMAITLFLSGRMAGAFRAEVPPAVAPSPATPVRRIIAEGRLAAYPGAEVTLSAELPAVIERIAVQEQQRIQKGAVVAVLKADEFRAQSEEAKARIAETDAEIRLLDLEVARASQLWESRHGSEQDRDRPYWQREALRARREARIADAHRLLAILAKMQIAAPIEGIVTGRYVDAGEMVPAGTALATITDVSRLRVEAEVDEFDAGRIRLGAAVTITAESNDGQTWQGVVEEVPDNVVGRRLKPQDPGRPIDTRILLVKITLPPGSPLKLGQRVDVAIDP